MKIEVIVMLFAGIGLPLLTFLYGLYCLNKKEKREARIKRVVSQMTEGPCDAASLLHRLSTSDILDLEDGNEIIEVCHRIESQEGKNPIPNHTGLSAEELKPFFAYVSVHRIDLSVTPMQDVIKIYKEKTALKVAA